MVNLEKFSSPTEIIIPVVDVSNAIYVQQVQIPCNQIFPI